MANLRTIQRRIDQIEQRRFGAYTGPLLFVKSPDDTPEERAEQERQIELCKDAGVPPLVIILRNPAND